MWPILDTEWKEDKKRKKENKELTCWACFFWLTLIGHNPAHRKGGIC